MSKLAGFSKTSQPVDQIRSMPEFDGHEVVLVLTDKDAGLRAYIAVHNSKLGMAHGGTRMQVYANEVDAMRDVLNLSKAMSYKSAITNLPYGGAKGVIVLKEPAAKRNDILIAYAKKVEQLNGLFHTGTDVGLTDDDVQVMAQHSRFMLGTLNSTAKGLNTSKAAAIGVYYAIKTAAQFKYGKDNLKGLRIAVKGLGKLGGELAQMLYEEGAQLIIADVSSETIKNFLTVCPEAVVVDPEDIMKQKVHIYAPCALGGEFDKGSIDSLNCEIIAGGANNQLCDKSAGDGIFAKGILYAPDYVINAGGLIFVSDELEPDGFSQTRVMERLSGIRTTLMSIFERSAQQNMATHRIADIIAEERMNKGDS